MKIKVKELVERLKDEDQDAIVLLSVDTERNYYRLLSGIDGNRRFNEEYEGIKLGFLTPELEKHDFSKEDVAPKEWEKAVVLWP